MKNKLWLIVLAAVIGFSFAALSLTSCENGTTTTDNKTTIDPDNGKTPKTLESIDVTKLPNKTRYNLGDTALDTTGMVVTAKYTDGSTEAVTGYTVGNEFDASTTGIKVITVTYQGKTTTFSVNVINPELQTVATPTADPAGGMVASGTIVTLSCATDDAEIWYTTNETVPEINGLESIKYTAPFAITPPFTINAVAFKDGMNSSGMLEAEYLETPITVADIDITAPTKGAIPATSVLNPEQDRFTEGTVTWLPNDNPFKPNTEYTATVTLTAKSGFTFAGLIEPNAKINEFSAEITNNTGLTVTLSHKFEATGEKAVSGMEITDQPANPNFTFTHGDTINFNLSGLEVELTYDDGTTEVVTYENFGANSITIVPANGIAIEYSSNGALVTINCAGFTETIGNLTVNRKSVADLTVEGLDDPYTFNGDPITPSISIKHPVEGSTRLLTNGTDYTLEYSNNINVGTATITITGIGNYTGSKIVQFEINAASVAAVSAPTLDSIGSGYWVGTVTINAVIVSNGQIVEYGISTTNNAASVSAWQDGLRLSCTAGYVNYIFARLKETGETSESLSVQIPYRIDDIYRVDTFLSAQPPNTADNPYLIMLNISRMGWPNWLNPDRYFSLDLSEITFSNNTISNGAFNALSKLTSVILPNTVTTIVSFAFYNCTSLASITIPDSVTSIGVDVFYGSTSLAAINVDAGNSTYSSQDGVLYNKDKTALFQYPSGKTDITFTVPRNVTYIEQDAFNCCNNLTAINVDASNSTYSSQDGVLYNKDKTVLLVYPAGKTNNTFTIPDSVTIIEESAFEGCTKLSSIIIPNNVTSIGYYTFNSCTSLTSVTFETGSNISNANFGNNAFPEGSTGAGGNTLKTAYNTGKAGTYTRAANGTTWSK
jgi:hypothetical protein